MSEVKSVKQLIVIYELLMVKRVKKLNIVKNTNPMVIQMSDIKSVKRRIAPHEPITVCPVIHQSIAQSIVNPIWSLTLHNTKRVFLLVQFVV